MATRHISLALQGGGAHGAFTWGVLERLLDEPALQIDGISGTSAGAINACVLAQGLARRGRAGAKAELLAFWRRLSERGVAVYNPYQTTPYHSMLRAWNLEWSPASVWLDMMAQFVSPYQLNPLDHNPLRDLLEERVDFALLRARSPVRLFICATDLLANRRRVFETAEVTLEAVLASACLPQLHRAVEIDGAFFWDGGFVGNPALKPLIRACPTCDLVLVQINPLRRHEVPITSRDIMHRVNEVTMNAALMHELDAIATISRLVRAGKLTDPRYHDIRLHRIADPDVMTGLGVRSRDNAAWAFLTHLRDAGRHCADHWLLANGEKIGVKSTLDLAEFEL